MKVIVGSTNPVKVGAVRDVFEAVWGKCKVEGVKVSSGVSEQPWGDEETIRGARNRAKSALEWEGQAEFGVGLEGGVFEQNGLLMECAWCVIRNKDGVECVGGGLRFELPPIVADKIRQGGELGPIMSELLNRQDVKKQEGAVGVFTKNRLTRKAAYKQLVNLAMIKFINEDWWK